MTAEGISKMKRRAEILARPIENSQVNNISIELLVFKLAEERYGIEIKHIREVYPLKDYTPLPCTPSFIFGLINIRRKIIAILDLKSFFNLSMETKGEKKIVILENNTKSFALVTDGIVGIERPATQSLQPALPTLTGVKQEFLQGITNDGIVVLDGHKLLTSKQLVVDEIMELS